MGLSTRIKIWKTDRIHHFFSEKETNYFLVLAWSPAVIDIREQFPLPLDETLDIAKRLGIKHPTDPQKKYPMVMTTDFLIDVLEEGQGILKARCVKMAKDLNSARVIEKLEIERTYWTEQGIDWGIVTEQEIPIALAENVAWLRTAYEPGNSFDISPEILIQIEERLYEMIITEPQKALSHIALSGDRLLGFNGGTCLWAVRHFIASLVWLVDMFSPIDPSKPLHVTRGAALEQRWKEVVK
jgi:hypothetical protein